jgi:site-specific DNA-methyltransferase (adenine-specific)
MPCTLPLESQASAEREFLFYFGDDDLTTEIQQQITEPDVLQLDNVFFAKTGLIVTDAVDEETWRRVGMFIGKAEGAIHWWAGDYVLQSDARWGEKYDELEEITGLSQKTLRSDKSIANSIELSRRRDNLSFSHHAEVAALEPDEQDHWLDRAEQGDDGKPWSRSKLRFELYGHKRKAALEAQEPVEISVDENLICGDCLTVTWPGDVALIFADPPYGLTKDDKSGVRAGKGDWDAKSYQDLHEFNKAWLAKAFDALKDEGSIFVSGTLHNIFSIGHVIKSMGFYIVRDIVWNKPFVQRQVNTSALVPSHEIIIWARKGERHTCNLDEITRDIWDIQPAAPYSHPTEKPEALLEKIISMASDPGDLVLDPFLGSGCSLAVAKRLKRAYWGVELDEYWHRIATDRISKS